MVDFPKREEWGDLSSSVAMLIAKQEKRPPLEVAHVIADQLQASCTFLEKVSVAPPGFLNVTLRPDCWLSVLEEIERTGDLYGHSKIGQGQRVLLEFVSANPTGPLHMGHGRGAALGEALARLLRAAGYEVDKEYYINDAGRQMKLLADSVYARYLEMHGRECSFPEDGYHGDYIKTLAQAMDREKSTHLLTLNPEDARRECGQWASHELVRAIKEDLAQFGVEFETWYSEASLFASGSIQAALNDLEQRDLVFTQDDATWFRSSRFQDEKDRWSQQDGDYTYLASDIAYILTSCVGGRMADNIGCGSHGYSHACKRDQAFAMVRLLRVSWSSGALLGREKVEMSNGPRIWSRFRTWWMKSGRSAKFFFLMRRRIPILNSIWSWRKSSPLKIPSITFNMRTRDSPVYFGRPKSEGFSCLRLAGRHCPRWCSRKKFG